MTAKTVTCVALACNTRGEFLDLSDDGGEQHFSDLAEAVASARTCDWIVWPDGFAVCNTEDPEHSAAIRELMPPEFDPVCDGQAEIPFTDETV